MRELSCRVAAPDRAPELLPKPGPSAGRADVSEATLFALQRLSAKLLAPLVIVHLALILYAVHGGLSAAEILDRTQGSAAWGGFLRVVVIAVAVHAPIGARNVAREWTRWRGRSLDAASLALAIHPARARTPRGGGGSAPRMKPVPASRRSAGYRRFSPSALGARARAVRAAALPRPGPRPQRRGAARPLPGLSADLPFVKAAEWGLVVLLAPASLARDAAHRTGVRPVARPCAPRGSDGQPESRRRLVSRFSRWRDVNVDLSFDYAAIMDMLRWQKSGLSREGDFGPWRGWGSMWNPCHREAWRSGW